MIAQATRTKIAVGVAALAAGTLMFTGCGGNSEADGGSDDDADGKYYYKSAYDYFEGQLVIDGTTVTYYDFGCSGGQEAAAIIEDEPKAEGQITDDDTQVIWASDDEHIGGHSTGGTQPFSLNAAGETKSITIGDFDFKSGDETEAVSSFDSRC